MVKQPVTVCYPQEKLTAPERLRGHIVNDMDVCICCGMCARRCPARSRAVVPPLTKLCRITELDSEPPTIRKIPKTKPQVDSLPFFKK